MRVTTRTEAGRAAIEAAGAECWIGTPERLGTLRAALESVTIVCWLLGTAAGSEEELGALHGSRLEFFLGQAIDTTVRGFVYEAAGVAGGSAVPADVLRRGRADRAEGRRAQRDPVGFLRADPGDAELWLDGRPRRDRCAARGPIDPDRDQAAGDRADDASTMTGDRPRYGLLVSAFGAVVLAVAVFLPWYGVSFTAAGIAFAQQAGDQAAAAVRQRRAAELHGRVPRHSEHARRPPVHGAQRPPGAEGPERRPAAARRARRS